MYEFAHMLVWILENFQGQTSVNVSMPCIAAAYSS